MKKHIPSIVIHTIFILILVLATILVVDAISPSMHFWNNALTKAIVGIFCLISAGSAVLLRAVYRH